MSLIFIGFEVQREQLFTTLHPHFGSLIHIEFDDCEALNSKTIQRFFVVASF